MDVYDNLKNGIVQQAAEDYAAAFMGNSVGYKDADATMRECEKFFRDEWYKQLTNDSVDGEWLMRNIKIRELEKVKKAYEDILNICNSTAVKAVVNFPKQKDKEKPKPMTYIFPPKMADGLMDTMRIQLESVKAEIQKLKCEEADI